MGHRNILTLVDYFETMNNCMLTSISTNTLPDRETDHLQCTS
jgi:hypothetical protein